MNRFIFVCVTLLVASTSYSQDLVFTYDAAGNQTFKGIVLSSRPASQTAIEEDEIPNEFTALDGVPEISYYPNPVQEQLHIKWLNKPTHQAQTITVYNNVGQQIFTTDPKEDQVETTIDFSTQPKGMYILIIGYTDGSTKDIKILKQ